MSQIASNGSAAAAAVPGPFAHPWACPTEGSVARGPHFGCRMKATASHAVLSAQCSALSPLDPRVHPLPIALLRLPRSAPLQRGPRALPRAGPRTRPNALLSRLLKTDPVQTIGGGVGGGACGALPSGGRTPPHPPPPPPLTSETLSTGGNEMCFRGPEIEAEADFMDLSFGRGFGVRAPFVALVWDSADAFETCC